MSSPALAGIASEGWGLEPIELRALEEELVLHRSMGGVGSVLLRLRRPADHVLEGLKIVVAFHAAAWIASRAQARITSS